jgi:hypothetical protein
MKGWQGSAMLIACSIISDEKKPIGIKRQKPAG